MRTPDSIPELRDKDRVLRANLSPLTPDRDLAEWECDLLWMRLYAQREREQMEGRTTSELPVSPRLVVGRQYARPFPLGAALVIGVVGFAMFVAAIRWLAQ